MFCTNCGREIPNGSRFCPGCGTPVEGAAPQPSPATNADPAPTGYAPRPEVIPAPQPAAPAPQPVVPDVPPTFDYKPNPYAGQPPVAGPALGMKWFKFIIWAQLFLSALSLVGSGVSTLLGTTYGDESTRDLIYSFYGGLRLLDIVIGLGLVALAVCCIVVRMELASFKRVAPQHYLMLLGANVAASLVYIALFCVITGAGFDYFLDSSYVAQLVTNVALIAANKVYFDKRAHLFTN